MTNNTLVIYHADCADGFGAAFAAWMKLGDFSAEYIPMKYGDITVANFDEEFFTNKTVYILDFSFPKEIMERLFSICAKVVWLDHHAGVFKDWGKEPNKYLSDYINEAVLGIEGSYTTTPTIILDNMRSGALIAWEYFHPYESAPELFQHLDDYDRWQFKYSKTKEFAIALAVNTPWSFQQWQDFLNPRVLKSLCVEGTALLKAQESQITSIIKEASACVFRLSGEGNNSQWHEGNMVNCPAFLTNEVGHRISTINGTFGLCWYQLADGKVKCSLRSTEYDVLSIAKAYGGGGHKTAAGFVCTMNELQEVFFPF